MGASDFNQQRAADDKYTGQGQTSSGQLVGMTFQQTGYPPNSNVAPSFDGQVKASQVEGCSGCKKMRCSHRKPSGRLREVVHMSHFTAGQDYYLLTLPRPHLPQRQLCLGFARTSWLPLTHCSRGHVLQAQQHRYAEGPPQATNMERQWQHPQPQYVQQGAVGPINCYVCLCSSVSSRVSAGQHQTCCHPFALQPLQM